LKKIDELLSVMEQWVGKEERMPPCEVEKGTMMKIPWAVGDPNPLWRDEAYARKTRYGGLIASPYFVEWLRFRIRSDYGRAPRPVTRDLPQDLPGEPENIVGGEEVEYFQPIRPGDTIHITSRTIDVKKRWSAKLGKDVVIQTRQESYRNQFGELVATIKCINIKSF
jgi:acyl dehydratase